MELLAVQLCRRRWRAHRVCRSTLGRCSSTFRSIFFQYKFCVDGGRFLSRVWHIYSLWIDFVAVCWCCCGGCNVKMERVWSIKAYISGDITAPAHGLTANWGHGIFLSAFAKWLRSSRMLKNLGRGLMLGGFAKSVRTASYNTTVFIFSLVALRILGFFRRDFLGKSFCVSFWSVLFPLTSYLEYNNCQM